MSRSCFLLIVAATAAMSSVAVAQNVTGYGSMPEPLLFLVREPAVHDDLALTQAQRAKLTELNHSFDGVLLSSRNIPPKESQAKMEEVLASTRNQVAQILTSTQQARLQQIKYRLRGISCVILPDAAERLGLSEKQKSAIETIVDETRQTIKDNSSATFQGKEAQKKSQDAVIAAQKAEQQKILATMDAQQRQRLSAMVGRNFDVSTLGRVMFKAPEFALGDQWINSKPLQLNDLRGKVVALHFYAFQ